MSRCIVLVITIVFATACQPKASDARVDFRSSAQKQSVSIFDLYFGAGEKNAAQDVGQVLASNLERLRRDFGQPFGHRVVVEIYHDQAAYDAHLMNPAVAGSPACSGQHTIQMVSPVSPIRVPNLPYETRLNMAVHELAHLFVDEINHDVPAWLDEGVAAFEGDKNFYRYIWHLPQTAKLLESPPSFKELETSYDRVRAADVYSFSAAEFIVERYGWKALRDVIRRPAEIERTAGVSKDELTRSWHKYMQSRYGSAARQSTSADGG